MVLVAALPVAAQQTDNLTGGGFDVPGSQSKAVGDAVQERIRRRGRTAIAVVLSGRRVGEPGRAGRGGRAGARRGRRGRRAQPAARRRAPRRGAAAAHGHGLLPAAQLAESRRRADRLGDDPARRPRPRRRRRTAVTPYLAGQPTIWAGMQELSKEDLAKAEASRLPDRRPDPARRLRLARRRGAAARARLRQRDRHRRPDLLHLAADGDLGLRHQHGLDDRDRGRDRLLALHPRPLPRGARAPGASRTRPAPRRSRPRAWRSPSPASP